MPQQLTLDIRPEQNPTLENNGGDVRDETDFRSVYASVLKDWFCMETTDIDTVLLDTYQPLALGSAARARKNHSATEYVAGSGQGVRKAIAAAAGIPFRLL